MGIKDNSVIHAFLRFSCIGLIMMISISYPILKPHELCADEAKAPQLFLEANQAYEKGDYASSAILYESVLNCGIHSGMIYYNLGNCYAKLGEIGKALLNYRRAERLMPRDGDLKFNLKYVLDQRKDKIETKEKIPFARAFFFWYYWLSLKELLFAFLAANLLFWSLSLVLLYKQHDVFRWIRTLSLCLLLVFGASSGIKAYSENGINQGVVVTSEATVRSGNGPNHSPLFILHEGAELRVSEKSRGWMKVRLADEKIGWISSSAVRII